METSHSVDNNRIHTDSLKYELELQGVGDHITMVTQPANPYQIKAYRHTVYTKCVCAHSVYVIICINYP